jgi:folylpolyglutamate synthase/dihydropteroate synthase
MTYQETIDHLYAHLPMFSRVGAIAYKEDLHNTIALCKALGDPHKKFKSIHIAGTNGKGQYQSYVGGDFTAGRIQNRFIYITPLKRFSGADKN